MTFELEYLKPYQQYCDLDSLLIHKKRLDQRREIKSAEKYKNLLAGLPSIGVLSKQLDQSEVKIGRKNDLGPLQRAGIEKALKTLIPWRKGPFNLFDFKIDGEWRSDFKWSRIVDSVDGMEGKRILDIGCNNGYFMFRMAAYNPELVMGIDPMLHYQIQFELMQYFAKVKCLHFEPFGVEHLPYFKKMFDIVFSMGIVYHHRDPVGQLIDVRESLRRGGQLILETLGIPGDDPIALFPHDRYAKMRNVYFLPTLPCLISWAKKAKFVDIEVVSDTQLTIEEQRKTDWCPPLHQSLSDFLDPKDPGRTIEGYPAPRRFCIRARKNKYPKH